MKLVLGIFINKFLTKICKLFGKKATVFPGGIVYDYFDKNILNKIKYPKYVIAVTGSSGKGSTCAFINHILINNGYDVAYNAYGSNAIRGITTLILNNCDYKGNFKKDVLLLECDERHLKLAFDKNKPTHLIITNITRDQPVRNISPYNILDEIKKGIGSSTHLIINADDAIVNELTLTHKGKITKFGLDKNKYSKTKQNSLSLDQVYCPICHTKLIYDYYHYGHLGNYMCPNKDFQRQVDYLGTKINLPKQTMMINNHIIKLNNRALYTAYNELASYTLAHILGIKEEAILKCFNENILPPKRGKSLKLGTRDIIMLESKNENNISYYQSMKYIINEEGLKTVILGFENVSRRYKENDLSWLYDTDFGLLNDKKIDKIFCIGRFKYDVATRLSYAGIDYHKIILVKDINNLLKEVKKESKGTIYTMVCFDMTEVLKKLIKGENNENI